MEKETNSPLLVSSLRPPIDKVSYTFLFKDYVLFHKIRYGFRHCWPGVAKSIRYLIFP